MTATAEAKAPIDPEKDAKVIAARKKTAASAEEAKKVVGVRIKEIKDQVDFVIAEIDDLGPSNGHFRLAVKKLAEVKRHLDKWNQLT